MSNTRQHTLKNGTPYIKIGKLFLVASLLSREEIKAAIREAKESGRMLGQVLIEKNKISEEILVAALRLQDMVWKGSISVHQAAEVLAGISQLKLGVAESFERIGLRFVQVERNITLCDFLRIAGYLSGETLEDIVFKTLDSPDLVAKITLNANLEGIDANDSDAVLKAGFYNNQLLLQILNATRQQDSKLISSASVLNELVHSGQLKLDQALVHLSMVKLLEDQQQVAA